MPRHRRGPRPQPHGGHGRRPQPRPAPRRPAITVLAFGRDDRAATPRAVVRLATSAPDGSPREAFAARDLPPSPSPRVLRDALASALLEAYTELAQ